jgi:hypothetical protein
MRPTTTADPLALEPLGPTGVPPWALEALQVASTPLDLEPLGPVSRVTPVEPRERPRAPAP